MHSFSPLSLLLFPLLLLLCPLFFSLSVYLSLSPSLCLLLFLSLKKIVNGTWEMTADVLWPLHACTYLQTSVYLHVPKYAHTHTSQKRGYKEDKLGIVNIFHMNTIFNNTKGWHWWKGYSDKCNRTKNTDMTPTQLCPVWF